MLLDPARFGFTQALERCFEPLRAALDGIGREHFVPWPVSGAYGSGWLVYPFFLASKPQDLVYDQEANQARCPLAMPALAAVPRLQSAAFSWMDPGCHIYEHVDWEIPHVIRAHLGLRIPDGAAIRVARERGGWREGRVTVFDGQIPHEAGNLAPEPRVVLLADFEMTPGEEDYVLGVRRSCAR
jgi:beta-hydroxylase